VGWGIAADCGVQSEVRSFGQRAAADCAALPTANAGQYLTLQCKLLLLWFPSKQQYINVYGDNYMQSVPDA